MNIRKVSMIGAGIMGSGIALTCAKAGYEVIIRDLRKNIIEKALGRIRSVTKTHS